MAVGGIRFVLLPFQRWRLVLELLQAEELGGGVVWGSVFLVFEENSCYV